MNRRASTSFHTQRHSAGGSRGTTPHRSHSFASRNNRYSYSRAGNNAKNNTLGDEDPHLATLKSNWKVPLVPPSSRYSLAGGFQSYPTSTTAPTTASTTARRGSRSSTQSARHSSARSSSASTNNTNTSRTSASARREAAAAAKAAATPPLRPPRRLPRCARCGRRFGSASILIHQARCNGGGGGGDSSLDDEDVGGFNTDFSLGAGWRRPWVGVAETQRTGRSSATSRLGHSSDRDRDGGSSAASTAAAAEPGLPSPFAHRHDAGFSSPPPRDPFSAPSAAKARSWHDMFAEFADHPDAAKPPPSTTRTGGASWRHSSSDSGPDDGDDDAYFSFADHPFFREQARRARAANAKRTAQQSTPPQSYRWGRAGQRSKGHTRTQQTPPRQQRTAPPPPRHSGSSHKPPPPRSNAAAAGSSHSAPARAKELQQGQRLVARWLEVERGPAPARLTVDSLPWPPQGRPLTLRDIGVDDSATADARKAAVKAATRRWHPDKIMQQWGPAIAASGDKASAAFMARATAAIQAINRLRETL